MFVAFKSRFIGQNVTCTVALSDYYYKDIALFPLQSLGKSNPIRAFISSTMTMIYLSGIYMRTVAEHRLSLLLLPGDQTVCWCGASVLSLPHSAFLTSLPTTTSVPHVYKDIKSFEDRQGVINMSSQNCLQMSDK